MLVEEGDDCRQWYNLLSLRQTSWFCTDLKNQQKFMAWQKTWKAPSHYKTQLSSKISILFHASLKVACGSWSRRLACRAMPNMSTNSGAEACLNLWYALLLSPWQRCISTPSTPRWLYLVWPCFQFYGCVVCRWPFISFHGKSIRGESVMGTSGPVRW